MNPKQFPEDEGGKGPPTSGSAARDLELHHFSE